MCKAIFLVFWKWKFKVTWKCRTICVCGQLTGEITVKILVDTLENFNIDCSQIVGQGYYGAISSCIHTYTMHYIDSNQLFLTLAIFKVPMYSKFNGSTRKKYKFFNTCTKTTYKKQKIYLQFNTLNFIFHLSRYI